MEHLLTEMKGIFVSISGVGDGLNANGWTFDQANKDA